MVIGELSLRQGPAPVAVDVHEDERSAAPELTIVVSAGPLQRVSKRVLDVLLACAALLVSLPVFAVIALIVRVTSAGPVLFRHERVGRDGERIRITKFRTMVPDAEAALERDSELKRRYVENGYKLRPEEDPRITRIGLVLRRLSLDELPQLWDVLLGRMSMVGPRPVMEEELHSYGHYLGAYLAVRPGLTGLWQVSGRSEIGFPERGRIDYQYAARWSFWLDVKVLFATIPTVLGRRGAY